MKLLILASLLTAFCSDAGLVSVQRILNGGIQPQTVVDEHGTHLLYYSGDPKAGDLFYSRLDSKGTWTKPLRANSTDGSAIAVGTIRGGQLAIGANGRVHVAWNGSKSLPNSKHKGSPMFYARINDAATAFEPQRDVMTFTGDLDGGGSVAADNKGYVYVVWHGHAPDAPPGEAGRAVYVAKSTDHGATFAKEVAVNPAATGACGCCGLKAFADTSGALYILYRAATDVVNRDEIFLASYDQGKSFKSLLADPWKIATCPMSSASISQASDRVLGAWETAGQVHFAIIQHGKLSRITPSGGAGKRKHPIAVANKNGDILLAWTEGTGWQRGGALSWQLFDKAGKPVGERGRQDGVPVWSFGAAFAQPDGNFVVLY